MSLWLRLKKNDSIDACIERLGLKFNGDKPYNIFPSHITIVPSLSNSNMNSEDIMTIVEEVVVEVKEELKSDFTLNLQFRDVLSEEQKWSQCVFLAADEENQTLMKLNASLMTRFHQEPGFQAPCRKPHLSLLYGEFSDQIKEEARDIVRQEYKNIFEEVFEMHTLELWQTGGGLDGVSKWQHVKSLCL